MFSSGAPEEVIDTLSFGMPSHSCITRGRNKDFKQLFLKPYCRVPLMTLNDIFSLLIMNLRWNDWILLRCLNSSEGVLQTRSLKTSPSAILDISSFGKRQPCCRSVLQRWLNVRFMCNKLRINASVLYCLSLFRKKRLPSCFSRGVFNILVVVLPLVEDRSKVILSLSQITSRLDTKCRRCFFCKVWSPRSSPWFYHY